MKNVFLLILVLLINNGCSRSYKQKNYQTTNVAALADIQMDKSEKEELPPPKSKNSKTEIIKPQTHEKKTIKDGKMGLMSDSVELVQAAISQEVTKLGGYVAMERLSHETSRKSLEITIRIPSKDFENLLKRIESGKCIIIYKTINVRDVTEEFIDIESRLQTKRKFADKYQELLKKANAVKDILEVEENLRTLQEEIESAEGKLKYIEDQVDFSTLEISVQQVNEIPDYKHGFGSDIWDSIKTGWQILVIIFLFIIKIWPIIILYFLAWLGIKRFRKLQKNKRENLKDNKTNI